MDQRVLDATSAAERRRDECHRLRPPRPCHHPTRFLGTAPLPRVNRRCRTSTEELTGPLAALMRQEGIPYLDATSKSVEELATTILHEAKLVRRIY